VARGNEKVVDPWCNTPVADLDHCLENVIIGLNGKFLRFSNEKSIIFKYIYNI
jgi:hypothetical protein